MPWNPGIEALFLLPVCSKDMLYHFGDAEVSRTSGSTAVLIRRS